MERSQRDTSLEKVGLGLSLRGETGTLSGKDVPTEEWWEWLVLGGGQARLAQPKLSAPLTP